MISSIKKFLLPSVATMTMVAGIALAAAPEVDKDNLLDLQLKDGTVVIQLLPEKAPKHVARVKELVRQHFYDGLIFHRVIPGFMAQGGDPTGTGMSGSGQNIPAEFNDESFTRNAVGAARSQDPNSADSQFFITLKDSTFLDHNYTVWGRVISGMQFVDKIAPGEPPASPDKIIKMTIESDQEKDTQGAHEAPNAAKGQDAH